MIIRDNRAKTIEKALEFVKSLSGPIFILGTNKYGLCTAKWLTDTGYRFEGFINDFIDEDRFGGYPVKRATDGLNYASIINCIVEGRTIDAEKNIIGMQPLSHIDYFALQLAYPKDLMQIDFLNGTTSIIEDIPKYTELQSRLVDPESRATLEEITDFRLNRDIKSLENFKFRLKEQYFEPFIILGDKPVFIDGGGFDGETTRFFIKLRPNYEAVYYFEPNETSLSRSRENLQSQERINIFQKGLWDKAEKLFFDNSLGSASKLSETGTSYIETIALDEVVRGPVDFIKLDIEGAETNALKGAKGIITRYRPALAVCVYHNQKDFIKIPELVLGYNPAYKIYLRHYTQGVFETVMYFV